MNHRLLTAWTLILAPLSWLLVVTGVGTFVGVFEPFGWELAGHIDAGALFAEMVAALLVGASLLLKDVRQVRTAGGGTESSRRA